MQEQQSKSNTLYASPKQDPKKNKPIIPIISQPTYKPVQTQNKIVPKLEGEIQKYKKDYLHLLQQNQLLQAHLAKVIREKDQLQKKFNNIHQNYSSQKSDNQDKKKRHRRVASEIARDYVCPNQRCGKSYGTDASLVQHIKLKHQQFFQNIRKNKGDKKSDRIPLNSLETQNKDVNI